MPVVRSKLPIKSRVEYKRPNQVKTTLGIREFYDKRKKVLIQRNCGGLGDILMHRMMFEDFKKVLPNSEIHFACPAAYHDAVKDHPFIDKLIDSDDVKCHDYIVHYNTSTACGRWEMSMAPLSGKHRSDIWAGHCGINLTSHDMHINLTDEEKLDGKSIIEKHRDRQGKTVMLAPISAMHNKNLSDELMFEVAEEIRSQGYFVFGLHNVPIYGLVKKNIPTIYGLRLRRWMSVINQTDYVVSVDTSHFHAAGGMKKPVVGIFTFVNGPTYSLYYPKVELVQGPCPLKYSGCYSWGSCPKVKEDPKLPCCSGITKNSILAAFNRLTKRFSDETS